MASVETARVAIIGAGYSGSLTAVHLSRTLPAGEDILLFDQSGRFAQGPAYMIDAPPHMLNVRAANMSATPDDPGGFERWLAAQAPAGEVAQTANGAFATRRLYGRYLGEMLAAAPRVQQVAARVTGLSRDGDGFLVRTPEQSFRAAAIVLATGGVAPVRPREGVVFHDPWDRATTGDLRPGEAVLIVGSSLTMVDLTLDLHASGFAGPIVALSRRGLVPHRHAPAGAEWTIPTIDALPTHSLATLLRWCRAEVRRAATQGSDWRAVMEALRPVTIALWQRLPASEQARFVRHLQSWWGVHRHRLAPPIADGFDRLRETGVVEVMRGRVRAIAGDERSAIVTVGIPTAPGTRMLEVQRVIMATGFSRAAGGLGLAGDLLASGLATTDPFGLGLAVDERLSVLAPDGTVQPGLWALGPLTRGMFWEVTSVPDIRSQAARVAEQVAKGLAG